MTNNYLSNRRSKVLLKSCKNNSIGNIFEETLYLPMFLESRQTMIHCFLVIISCNFCFPKLGKPKNVVSLLCFSNVGKLGFSFSLPRLCDPSKASKPRNIASETKVTLAWEETMLPNLLGDNFAYWKANFISTAKVPRPGNFQMHLIKCFLVCPELTRGLTIGFSSYLGNLLLCIT